MGAFLTPKPATIDTDGNIWRHRCGCVMRKYMRPVFLSKSSRYSESKTFEQTYWQKGQYCDQHKEKN